MFIDEYTLAFHVKDEMARRHAVARRLALVRSLRSPSRPVRVVLGMALIKAGRWVLRHVPEWRTHRPGHLGAIPRG